MSETQTICWINGEFKSKDKALISVFDHGFLYGDGVFEGIRFYHKKAFRLPEHIQRLFDSAQAIALSIPMPAGELTEIIQQVVAASNLEHGYIRLIITRGKGCLGINPNNCTKPSMVIIADQLNMIDEHKREHGVCLITAATRKLALDAVDPRIKSLNYLNHIMARMEANHAGADEALLLNNNGHITEGTADNVFIEKDGKLITPPTSDGALAGITRATIIELAIQAGITVCEQSIAPYDVYTADACFLTGTGAELIPVASIDGRHLRQCPSDMFKQLSQHFQALIEHEIRT